MKKREKTIVSDALSAQYSLNESLAATGISKSN